MSVVPILNPSREEWNRFVAAQPGATIYQSYEWGEIRRAHGWDPIYLALTDGKEWMAAALILTKRIPGNLGTIFYSPRGPIAKNWEGVVPQLRDAARTLARERNALFWRIEPPTTVDDLESAKELSKAGFSSILQEWSYWNRPKYEMQLNIAEGETAAFGKLTSKIRTKVRHASKRGVVIEEGCGEQDLESFYRLLQDTGMKKRIPVRRLDYFQTLYQIFVKSGMGRLFIARKEGAPVAAGLTVRFGSMATLLYLSNDYSMQRAGWAVQWEMLRWAMAQGCTIYDFGGTGTTYPPQETDKGYGVYQFKQSFGAQIIRWYGYADYVYAPVRYAAFRLIENNLPYGERLFIEWPKQILYRWRSKAASLGASSQETKEKTTEES